MTAPPEVSLFPHPPDHFKFFGTPGALQPPPPGPLANAEFYMMFGRPVPNIKVPTNQQVVIPPIDQDVLLYNTSGDLREEAKKLVSMLPFAVDEVFRAMQVNPDGINEHLRKFDNIIKSLYHLIEISREPEALDALVILADKAVNQKRKFLDDLTKAIEEAKEAIDARSSESVNMEM